MNKDDRVSANVGRIINGLLGNGNIIPSVLLKDTPTLVQSAKDLAFAIEDAVNAEILKRSKAPHPIAKEG